MTDSAKYREGKVKSTPVRGVKEDLKPCVYKPSELEIAMTCLLENDPASYCSVARLSEKHAQPQRKQVLIGRLVAGPRPETRASDPWAE